MRPFLQRGILTRFFFFILLIGSLQQSIAQSIFNANYNNFNFLAASKVHKVGSSGISVGDITLYTNVITVAGQPIDCIIRTVSLTGGTFVLPGGAPGGTIPFDYASATGTGMSANEDRFFAPTFNWTSAGSCRFRFEFILGGSYNNGTNTGTPVIMENLYINTYDIDGNGSANSNQNNEFGTFNTLQYKTTGGNLIPTYNATTGMTRLRSNTTTNTSTVVNDNTRIKIGYGQVSTIDIIVGADGGGVAYYFLDFGQGPAWTSTPGVITTPVLDMSTTAGGINNNLSTCFVATRFTEGAGNITGSTNAVTEMEIMMPSSAIADGNSEVLLPKTPTGVADSIRLGAPFTGTQSIVINTVTYQVTRSSGAGMDTIRIRPSSGTFTTAQAETFLDSLRYINRKALPTAGIRNFTVIMREDFIKTIPAAFQMNVNCSTLPVTWLSFTATKQQNNFIALHWSTTHEINAQDYLVQHSTNGNIWTTITTITATNNSSAVADYQYIHSAPAANTNFYRIVQRDMDGKQNISTIKQLSMADGTPALQLLANPVQAGNLQVQINEPGLLQLISSNGQQLLKKQMSMGTQTINISNYKTGIYHLRYGAVAIKVLVQ